MSEPSTDTAAPAPPVEWSIPRGLIVLLSLAAGVITIGGLKAFSGIVGPVFLALMLTIAVQPIQGWARRKGWPAWLGMAAALVAVIAILFGIGGALALSAVQLASLLPEYADKLNGLLDHGRDWLASLGVSSDQIHKALSGIDTGKAVSVIEELVGGVLGVFSNLFFVVALLLFMAVDGMTMERRLSIVARERPAIAQALGSFVAGTRKYLIVSTVFGAIVAVIDGGALWLMGVPLPILWALLSFITNYIPNIGFVIGVIPPALLALLDSGPVLMVWVIVVYSVINFVIQSIIQPKFVGDAVGLSVTITFLSLVFWAWVIGALGALLAIPLTLLVKALLFDIDPTTRWADVLIGAPMDQKPASPEKSGKPVAAEVAVDKE
ncbi:AI-2E family transporter [Nocardia fluminea]|uniref:Putative PurR-regulated permease PerM n=1 Tax=Nocardia fluminea TaxID=134984 RepID=A0A2N3WZ90_9NOCA|nr:AI-2E family transporter [Nocardia fluminea]PKV99186.1 putative PurR-regulated permease PerM [Nocardia fluminea]